jgi:hypothetical protein
MNRLFVRVGVAGIALSAVGLFVPTTAADAASGLRLHSITANSTAPGEAGYVASAPATSKVVDHFTVPAVLCGSAQQFMAVGAFIGGSGGTSAATAVPLCSGGSAGYVAVVLVNGALTQATTWAPAPGDHMVATAKESAAATTVTIKDTTQLQSLTATGLGQTNSAALWGVDTLLQASGAPFPVPTFRSIKYTSATQNGATVSANGGVPVDLEETTVLDIHTGPLSFGKNFTQKWLANG